MRSLFPKPLIEGLIKNRPNRFIMNVEIEGKIEKCHCPSTGAIASVKFEDIPCLLSKSDDLKRKTKYTVEAVSLRKEEWIGINQTKANEYVEFFLKNGMFSEMIGKVDSVKREVPLGNSRTDFLVNGRDYIEVKTLLKDIDSSFHPKFVKRKSGFVSFDRLIKHFGDVSSSIKDGSRAIFLLCNIYDAPMFAVPKEGASEEIVFASKKAHEKGLETWQINMKLDKTGIDFVKCFKLKLF